MIIVSGTSPGFYVSIYSSISAMTKLVYVFIVMNGLCYRLMSSTYSKIRLFCWSVLSYGFN